MKLYEFDGIDARLELIPLAARRALDAVGAKLSLEGFRSLAYAERRELVDAGSGRLVDEAAARRAIAGAIPPAAELQVPQEPSDDAPSEEVRNAFGPAQPIPDKVWQSLSPLDRYVLTKVTEKNRPPRVRAAYEEIIGASAISTHVRPGGGVHMVSIAGKEITQRRATAECWVKTSASAYERLVTASAPKGDVLGTARLAGLMAAKKTSDLIPLCHPIALTHAEIDFEEHPNEAKIRVTCQVQVEARTGAEMEAMIGASIAALTIYDMLKSIDRAMEVGPARLVAKSGGRSGHFSIEEQA